MAVDAAAAIFFLATPLHDGEFLQYDLNANDYNTAREVARVINARMGEGVARPINGRVVQVKMPDAADARSAFARLRGRQRIAGWRERSCR